MGLSIINAMLAVLLLISTVCAQKETNTWSNRSAIVHLFEWKFDDIAKECEQFLSLKGFAGVQISPVNEYLVVAEKKRPWWERYQPISYKIASRSGNESAFKDMVQRCNRVGIRIYVDVVLNHMAANFKNARGSGGSTADPKKLLFPEVPYGPEHFNSPSCIITDWHNPTQIRNCNLLGCHDLNQTNPHVREKMVEFLDKLVDIGIAGFRIDAAKHMWPEDLEHIFRRVKNLNTDYGFEEGARPFFYQEVNNLGGSDIRSSEYTEIGRITDFKYGTELSSTFSGQKPLYSLKDFGPAWELQASENSVVFIDNHDSQREGRVLTYKQAKQYKMAMAFMMAWPHGYPRIMSSYDFCSEDNPPPHDSNLNIKSVIVNKDGTCGNGWVCEHRWRQIYSMVEFRNTVQDKHVNTWWDNMENQFSFCRGEHGFIVFNGEQDDDLNRLFQTCLPEGTYCDIMSGVKRNGICTGKSIKVHSDRTAQIQIPSQEKDGVIAIHTESKL